MSKTEQHPSNLRPEGAPIKIEICSGDFSSKLEVPSGVDPETAKELLAEANFGAYRATQTNYYSVTRGATVFEVSLPAAGLDSEEFHKGALEFATSTFKGEESAAREALQMVIPNRPEVKPEGAKS